MQTIIHIITQWHYILNYIVFALNEFEIFKNKQSKTKRGHILIIINI